MTLRGASRPAVTLIVPVYCGEKWIEGALLSLVGEAGHDFEVIVVDSSPNRATAEIAERFADRLSLRIVERPDLDGWQAKTNFGVGLARADHVCTLHPDDLWLPGRGEEIRRWIAGAPGAVLHLAPTAIIDGAGVQRGVWRCPLPAETPLAETAVLERLLVQNFVAIPSPVFRRDAWLRCGGLDLDLWYTGDWDMWLKLAREGDVLYHDRVTAAFRVHGNSLTVSGSHDRNGFRAQMQSVLSRHIGRLPAAQAAPVKRAAAASIDVNVALAAASRGEVRSLAGAAMRLLSLGPFGLHRYLRDSRLADRVFPRVRAKLAKAF